MPHAAGVAAAGPARGPPQGEPADQRDSWVGSHMMAAEECGASPAFVEKYGLWLAMTVSAYAPFVDERTGALDWMEESSY